MEDNEKVNVLMNKLNQFETTLKDERKQRLKLEDEVKNYKTITIPSLERNLEDKESLCKSVFIEKIRLEKTVLEKLEKNLNDKNVTTDLFLDNEKNTCLNKLEYYQSAYRELKLKYKTLEEEKAKLEVMYTKKLEVEKEKNNILNRQLQEKEGKIESLNNEMLNLTGSNKDLLTELRSINSILDNTNKYREVNLMEIAFYKNEVELL
jgi:hypothetical protein